MSMAQLAGQLGKTSNSQNENSPEHENAKLLNLISLPRNARIDTPKQKGNTNG